MMKFYRVLFSAIFGMLFLKSTGQRSLRMKTYTNPIIHADYSDPDAIRVGDYFYMTSSSFEDIPGLPILRSSDLVNWKLIGHGLKKLIPEDYFSVPRPGQGVWAPSIRYHKNEFVIYYPDPDFGIYMIRAKKAEGPWSEPVMVLPGKGLIDPCPLYEGGKVFLVHAFAGSRAGMKSVIALQQLDSSGTKPVGESVLVYDGHGIDPTIEGPKIYKRNGYYYIFAPAGGVTEGWQVVLRSKNIYGPYERKVVLQKGSTGINGPHQGAWVQNKAGEDWFLHFQDKGPYGRIVHLQPMSWKEDWPVMGKDINGDGIGEPVMEHAYPKGVPSSKDSIAGSDDFTGAELGKQWQWSSNPDPKWSFLFPSKGVLRLYATKAEANLWGKGNVLQQKFPALSFSVTTAVHFQPSVKGGERTGLVVMGGSYAGVTIEKSDKGYEIKRINCVNVFNKGEEKAEFIAIVDTGKVYFRLIVTEGAICKFSYSIDGKTFIQAGAEFTAEPGKWKGAKFGIFCSSATTNNDSGFADFDWLRVD